MIFGFVLVAILIGAMMPVQAALNAELTRFMKHPFLGAMISLTIGAIAVLIFAIFKGGVSELKRIGEVPPHLFLGGILGALFVASSLYFIPRMGATAMIAAFITGQLVGSVFIDHYGLLGLQASPVSMTRIIGLFLLFAGLFLVIKKST